MWEAIEPRSYERKVAASGLVQSLLIAFAARLSGLRAIAERCSHLLGTENIATISGALSRRSSLRLAEEMVGALEARHTPGPGDLVAIDSMAVCLPRTQRHRCRKMNDSTVGGGVVWAHMLDAPAGACPVRILKIVDGAWSDAKEIRGVGLEADGSIRLMDRGFYALDNIERWLRGGVDFIIRARRTKLVFEDLETRGEPRRIGDATVEHDAVVRLGGAQAKTHPVVRLVVSRLPDGDDLIVASGLLGWSAEDLLAAYKRRWGIECFHRFLKDTLGLAHLYSFHRVGLRFLLHVAVLLVMLLYLSVEEISADTVTTLHCALGALRAALGLGTTWRRNTCAKRRSKSKGRDPKKRTNH